MMKIKRTTFYTLILLLPVFAITAPESTNAHEKNESIIQKAIENQTRPAKDRQRDIDRKPFEIMSFSDIGPGDIVADIGSAGGYYTRILSDIVGTTGHVYGFNGKEFARVFKNGNPTDPIAEEHANVTSIMGTFNAPVFSKMLDAAIIVLIYHDTHLSQLNINTEAMNKALFDAIKPGGTLIIVDHKAELGSGTRDVEKFHRIDKLLVKEEVENSGFRFVAESNILDNPNDALNTMVMMPDVRGKSERFIFKFKKPE